MTDVFPSQEVSPFQISGNKRSGENRIHGIEAKSNAILKSKRSRQPDTTALR